MGAAVSSLGASALSAGVGALGSIAGAVAGGLFSANQAKKNRAFQERMYKKQVEDTINFWNMQNEYNLPSAQLQRLRDAGLNPMLMYGQGGVQNVATGSPDLPSAPHGAQASAGSFNTPLEFANLALVNAQTKLAESQAEKNTADAKLATSQTKDVEFDVMFKNLTKDLNLALKWDEHDLFNARIRDFNSMVWQRDNLTTQNVLTMIQDRDIAIKRFHLDKDYQGNMIAQGWESLKIGKMNANASLQQAAAAMIQARNAAAVGNAQIALFAQEYAFNVKANPTRLQTLNFEKLATQAGWKTEQARTFEREFKNKMLGVYGAEQLPNTYTGVAGFASQVKQGFLNLLDPRWWLTPIGTKHK